GPGRYPLLETPRCTASHADQSCRLVMSQKSTAYEGSNPSGSKASGGHSHAHSIHVSSGPSGVIRWVITQSGWSESRMLGVTVRYQTIRSSPSGRFRKFTPLDEPSRDIVTAKSLSSMVPPSHMPVGWWSLPESTGVTSHSSGWIEVQW